ncbi:hypothetical protein BCR42DRAFT_433021 [Absidia repens]|uniref:Retrotransposon gag domain-containing protein n=1 Tax=Absidia repens TaxID=90262 RepID=A0A1X2IWF6_9FUNG|nr:hypothetical protein BCR42DRAFT_433021 [Absidia repens]
MEDSGPINLRPYVDKPDRYYGTQQENPLAWIRNLKILKNGLQLGDRDVLFLASTLLKGSAASWWDMMNDKVATWVEFESEFVSFFVSEETRESWWTELECLRQGSLSVGEVQLQLEELPTRSRPEKFLDTIKEAKRVEALKNKYLDNQNGRKPPTYLTSSTPSSYSYESGPASSVNATDRLAEDFTKALKIHMANLNLVGLQQQQGYEGRGQDGRFDGPPKSVKLSTKLRFGKRSRAVDDVVGTAVLNNNQGKPKNEEAKKAFVVQGVKMWNVNTEGRSKTQGVRTRSVVSDEPEVSQGKRRTVGTGVVDVVRDRVTNDKPARKKRAPPGKLEVDVGETDVWSVLKSTDSGVSLAQLIATNKKVAGDIQAGIRCMHGPKKKSVKIDNKGKGPQVYRASVRCIENSDDEVSSGGEYDSRSEGSDDSSEGNDVDSYLYPSGYSSGDESSEVESEVEDSSFGYESDDTHYEYAYDINRLKEASPFMVTAKIGKLETEAVVDTGAATLVISKGLAKKLGLRVNGDRMTIEQLDGNPSKPNGVCEQVRLRVGGKLRPEHFIVHDNKADLMLLGMTWFEAYGAVPLPQERRLVIPTRSGKDVVVQGSVSQEVHAGEDEAYEKEKEVLALPEGVQLVLDENDDKVFVETAELGKVEAFEHKIVTPVDAPNISKPYRVTWQEDECVKEACTKYNLRLKKKKKKKSYFSRQEDECLGHAISTNGSLQKGSENPADALSRQRQLNTFLVRKQSERNKTYPLDCESPKDKKRYEVGDQVLLLDNNKAEQLDDMWLGPFSVTKANSNGTYWLIGKDQRRLQGAVNVEKLRPWNQRKSLVPNISSGPLLEFVERKRR